VLICVGGDVSGLSPGYDAPGSSPGSPPRSEGAARRAELAGVAQSAERRTRNAQVKGSIPFSGSESSRSEATPAVYGLTCPSEQECWAAGSKAIPQRIGIGIDEGSPVLLGTKSAGATWSKVTFSVGSKAPNPDGQSYLDIGNISCPSTRICLAQGSAAQGARVSPIYALVTSGR
jgi:hypothetical protein